VKRNLKQDVAILTKSKLYKKTLNEKYSGKFDINLAFLFSRSKTPEFKAPRGLFRNIY